jgi:hypothetical protein
MKEEAKFICRGECIKYCNPEYIEKRLNQLPYAKLIYQEDMHRYDLHMLEEKHQLRRKLLRLACIGWAVTLAGAILI